MRYSIIKKYDISNGSYIRTSIFFCGCTHHCKNCFNKELWDFKSGKPFDDEAKELLFSYLSDEHVKGLSVLGGEPMQQGDELYDLLSEVKKTFPDKNIWLWTGYYLDELDEKQLKIAKICDYIVDGRFEEDKSGLNIKFRGSTNQTIYKVENGDFIKSEKN